MILNESHGQWPSFCLRMLEMQDSCDHTFDFTRECLNLIPGIDAKETVRHFRRAGGACDCEVILNIIQPSMDKDAPVAILDKHIVIKIPGHSFATYEVALHRCKTMEQLSEWTRQLCDKSWITDGIVMKFRKLAMEAMRDEG